MLSLVDWSWSQWGHYKGLSVNVEFSIGHGANEAITRVCPSMLSPVHCSWSQWGPYKGLSVNVESSRLVMELMRPLQGSVRQCWVQYTVHGANEALTRVCPSMLSPVHCSWSQWGPYKGLSVNVESSRLVMEPGSQWGPYKRQPINVEFSSHADNLGRSPLLPFLVPIAVLNSSVPSSPSLPLRTG